MKDTLEYHNRTTGDMNESEDEFDADKAIKSQSTLAIDVQIYMNLAEPQAAILCIISDLTLLLYK